MEGMCNLVKTNASLIHIDVGKGDEGTGSVRGRLCACVS